MPTTFAVFSATGVLVKSFVALPQSAEGTFKTLQIPHGTYYLKNLNSNYIKKVAKLSPVKTALLERKSSAITM